LCPVLPKLQVFALPFDAAATVAAAAAAVA
jgi:hypothetical protein